MAIPNHGFRTAQHKPIVLGHRGVPKLVQENTLAGFRKALELGIDGVEFDVYRLADGKLVVFHDEDAERLTGVKGNITALTWDQVSRLRIQRRVDMGDGTLVEYPAEQPIPLLDEVLEEFRGKLLMNIEMKAYRPIWGRRHTGTEVAKIIRRTGCEASVIVTSFDFYMLFMLEREYPGLQSGFAYDDDMLPDRPARLALALYRLHPGKLFAPREEAENHFVNFLAEANLVGSQIGSTLVDLECSLIDGNTIKRFRARDHMVGAYTLYPLDTHYVRDRTTPQDQIVERLTQHGVDWFETDDPVRMLERLRELNLR
jgi:glycerophosphoryl diester phosphodiesterase